MQKTLDKILLVVFYTTLFVIFVALFVVHLFPQFVNYLPKLY